LAAVTAITGGQISQLTTAQLSRLTSTQIAAIATSSIDDLTAEVTALRAKVAQYEQAPVVGWASPNQVQELKDGYDGFMVPISMDQFAIPLIVRPEVTK
jgi:hypothetical protein